MSESPSKFQLFFSELVGTFILIFIGCGAVHAAVAYGAQAGLWQVAICWGLAIIIAIYCTASISGCHINPAITIAMAAWSDFPAKQIPLYIGGQFAGAFLAAAVLFGLFSPALAEVEQRKGVKRGQPGSEITASCYGEFYPNPGGMAGGDEPYSAAEHEDLRKLVPHEVAFFAELIGTALLSLVVFCVTDDRNSQRPGQGQAAIFIGLTVAMLISVIAPLTQACFNPARDFAPRLFAFLAGWGDIALPLGTDWGWLTVYIVAPILGGLLGGGLYRGFFAAAYRNEQAQP